jgi:hypothetical protein
MLLAIGFVSLNGCAPGKRPFLQARACLKNGEGASAFASELQSIAREEGVNLIDGSAQTKKNLGTVGYVDRERKDGSSFIYVGIELGDGIGMTAGNLGMPGYQVAVGFSEGSNPARAHRFATKVINRLSSHWRVELVPGEVGVTPMSTCD